MTLGSLRPRLPIIQASKASLFAFAATVPFAMPAAAQTEAGSTGEPLSSETAADEPSEGSTNTIIVSAQRRDQAFEDVPTSVTVFDSEELATQRIESAPAVLQRTPNVSFNSRGSILTLDVSIRGVSNIGGIVNSVGVYVDEFNVSPLATSDAISPELFDLERVEVLRGPQGTLFGRNVAGGAISYTSVKPQPEFDFSLTAEAANNDSYFARGMINVPLGEIAAVRATGFYRERGGFIEDIDPAGGLQTNDVESWGGRVAVRVEPTDTLKIDLAANYRDFSGGLDGKISTGIVDAQYAQIASVISDVVVFDILNLDQLLGPQVGALLNASRPIVPVDAVVGIDDGQGFFPENEDFVSYDAPFSRDSELQIYTLQVRQEGPGFDIIGNFGMIDTATNNQEDEDRTSINSQLLFVDSETESASAEIRLQSNNSSPFQWVVGGLIAQDRSIIDTRTDFNLFGIIQSTVPLINASPTAQLLGGTLVPSVGTVAEFEAAVGAPPGSLAPLLDVDFSVGELMTRRDLDSIAVFADGSYEINDRLSLGFGIRYSSDEVEARIMGPANFNPLSSTGFDAPTDLSGDASFDAFTPRFTVLYELTDDVNSYAQVSRGTKPGGLNLNVQAQNQQFNGALPTEFEQESLWNYEAGVKGYLFNRNLLFSLTGFYMDWSNVQVDGIAIGGNAQAIGLTQNVPDAESYGFEFDATGQLTDNIKLFGSIGFNETEIGVFDSATGLDGAPQSVTGNALALAPEWTLRAGSEVTFPVGSLGDWEIFGRGEYLYQDEQFRFITDQNPGDAGSLIPSYDTVSFTAGIRSDRIEVLAFADNLGEAPYVLGLEGGISANGLQAAFVPETYGVRVRFSY